MRACIGFVFLAFLANATPTASEDLLSPTAAEIRAAMSYVGLPSDTPIPAIVVVSKEEMARLSLDVPYVSARHLHAIGIYHSRARQIFLREDWRRDGMPLLVHEMRHYAQDLLALDTSRVGGKECDAYAFEEEYQSEHRYPPNEIVRIIQVQMMLNCPVIFVPYQLPRSP